MTEIFLRLRVVSRELADESKRAEYSDRQRDALEGAAVEVARQCLMLERFFPLAKERQ